MHRRGTLEWLGVARKHGVRLPRGCYGLYQQGQFSCSEMDCDYKPPRGNCMEFTQVMSVTDVGELVMFLVSENSFIRAAAKMRMEEIN